MSLLKEWLKASTDQEILTFKANLKLKGEEARVFKYFVEKKGAGDASKKEALRDLNMTSTHFDKINTILLRKCYKLIAVNENELLFHLNQKILIKHLLHEIKLKERLLKKNQKVIPYKTRKIYFDLIAGVPARFYNEKKTILYGNSLIESSTNTEDITLYVKCRILYARLNIIRHGKPSQEGYQKITNEIFYLESLKNYSSLSPETQLWIYKSISFYYIRISNNREKHIMFLNKIKFLYEQNYLLPSKEKAVNDCNIASHYYDCNELIQAQNHYIAAFKKYSDLLTSEVRHIARFIEISVILNDFTLAETVYRKWLRIFLKTEHEAFGVLASITYAKFLIFTNKFKEALRIIQHGKILNSRFVYYKYDIELRMLENIIFALRKDYHFAQDLAHKNLKHISSQSISVKKFIHAHFFKLIIYFINNLIEEVPIPANAINYYKKYQQGELIIYGQLLKRLK